MKTVYITRNNLFRGLNMYLFNQITEVDPDFIDDNFDLFSRECETCKGKGEDCQDCEDGYNNLEVYQYFLIGLDKFDKERLEEFGVKVGYSEKLDEYILPIYDFGTSWSAFSYSKEVPDNYELNFNETLERTTPY